LRAITSWEHVEIAARATHTQPRLGAAEPMAKSRLIVGGSWNHAWCKCAQEQVGNFHSGSKFVFIESVLRKSVERGALQLTSSRVHRPGLVTTKGAGIPECVPTAGHLGLAKPWPSAQGARVSQFGQAKNAAQSELSQHAQLKMCAFGHAHARDARHVDHARIDIPCTVATWHIRTCMHQNNVMHA
jgi:hypothetical protein